MWSKLKGLTDIFSKLWTDGGTDRHNDLYFLLVTDLNKSLMIALIFILKCFYFLIDFHCKVSFCNLQSHSGGMDGGLAEVNIQKKIELKVSIHHINFNHKNQHTRKKGKTQSHQCHKNLGQHCTVMFCYYGIKKLCFLSTELLIKVIF